MKKQGMRLAVFLLMVLSLVMILFIGQLLSGSTAAGKRRLSMDYISMTEEISRYTVTLEPLHYYSIRIHWPSAAAPAADKSPGQYLAELGFPVVIWQPAKQQGNNELKIEMGFTADKSILEPWLQLLKEKGLTGVLWERNFPGKILEYEGEVSAELPELMSLLNEQLRHLNRAADFFSYPWQKLQGGEITELRLELLRKEASQCVEKMKEFVKENQKKAAGELYNSVYRRLTDWQQTLLQLDKSQEEIQVWVAQQKAQALICQWQQLLLEIGFM